MAGGAFCGRWLIKENLFLFHIAELRVASLARRVLVRALQRKDRLLVIEARRTPAARVMAFCTTSNVVRVGELRPMWVVMTLLAGERGGAEIDVQQLALHRRWPMAADALHRFVRPSEVELRR